MEVERWWQKLKPLWGKYCRIVHLPGYEADDIKQECYLLLVQSLERFEPSLGVPFESYYKMVLRGWLANKSRQTKNKSAWTTVEDEVLLQKDETINIEREIEQKEEIKKLKLCMAELLPSEQQLILAYYFKGQKLKEIAFARGLSYKKVENQKRAILKKLKKAWKMDA